MIYNKAYFKNILPKRPEISNKGTFGHVLNIAGSGFYSGAAYFSSVAALKVGCGRSTLASVEAALRAASSLSPDIILMPLAETKDKTISQRALRALTPKLSDFDAISIGCGISTNEETGRFFEKVVSEILKLEKPLVIDADGLNFLAKFPPPLRGRAREGGLKKILRNLILTPHPKEMSRLMGVEVEKILKEPEMWAKKCCEKYCCTVVLKLHETIVVDVTGNIYVNKTGNSALAHGGSGDILCGMITGFLAQGLSTFDASCLAVYLHGITAELASKDLTEYSVLASDLLKYIPQAIKILC